MLAKLRLVVRMRVITTLTVLEKVTRATTHSGCCFWRRAICSLTCAQEGYGGENEGGGRGGGGEGWRPLAHCLFHALQTREVLLSCCPFALDPHATGDVDAENDHRSLRHLRNIGSSRRCHGAQHVVRDRAAGAVADWLAILETILEVEGRAACEGLGALRDETAHLGEG